MARSPGKKVVEGGLRRLREELQDYFGALNELQAGIKGTKIPDQPEALKKWRQCQTLGLPLCSGGVMDQPHIWLMEIAVVIEMQQLFAALERAAAEQSGE